MSEENLISFVLYKNVDSILQFVSLYCFSPGQAMTYFRAMLLLFFFLYILVGLLVGLLEVEELRP